MWCVESRFKVVLGGNTYINTPNLIVVDGEPLFQLKRSDGDGVLGIYFDIYDRTGSRVAAVKRNEIYLGKRDDYEILESSDEYSIRERATGRVLCSIRRLGAGPAELEVSVSLYTRRGFLLHATPTGTNVAGARISGCVFEDCGAGIAVSTSGVGR